MDLSTAISKPHQLQPPKPQHVAFLLSLFSCPTDLWNHTSTLLKNRIRFLQLDKTDLASYKWPSKQTQVTSFSSSSQFIELADKYYPPEDVKLDMFQIHLKQQTERDPPEAWVDLNQDGVSLTLSYEEGQWLYHDLRTHSSGTKLKDSGSSLSQVYHPFKGSLDAYWDQYSDVAPPIHKEDVSSVSISSSPSTLENLHLNLKNLSKEAKSLGLEQDQFMAFALSSWVLANNRSTGT